ncbi:GPI mannosyltransferase 3 [Coccidioides immitis RS]|uniref:Mannosyltransferase n=1 Tax=Coccidioides immitis (strain RS) TaxID=246410 RepID=J3K4I2_COCIM|nr:GPI mannosyltransferase 3 [Coccidioides immitis RS]EAS29217.3 GPI mannosyltransferase 3 [Coccidioides immitis RS]
MSASSAELSGSSTGTDGRDPGLGSSFETLRRRAQRVHRRFEQRPSRDILLFLVAFRILNALCVRTFFQPDEFFQSLEPAWQIAFGKESGAWITWEWKHHLRSSIHPYIFAAVYWVADQISRQLRLSPLSRADLLVAAPKTAQGVIAALGDYYTWKLAGTIYGADSYNTRWALCLSVLSPWQWFCSTRTLSNCLETTLTAAALSHWPWQWNVAEFSSRQAQGQARRITHDRTKLRYCLLLAAFACILRPTNLIIWFCLAIFTICNISSREGLLCEKHVALVWEAFCCGFSVLSLSLLADRIYYGSWTLPPFKFLYFNIAQSLAVFYGRNDWHYYLSQGYPLLLTTALPFTLAGLSSALAAPFKQSGGLGASIRRQLGIVCIAMPAILSLISHKEVRFIYPILPSLHILTAPPLSKFFEPAISYTAGSYLPRRLLLSFLILVNLIVAFYTSVSHASGPSKVFEYIRHQSERVSVEANIQGSRPQPPVSSLFSAPVRPAQGLTVGFLMPCHSTPWRSHFVFPSIEAWALSCEPPVNFNESQRAAYIDEADQFYADPSSFLRTNMVGGLRHFPHTPTYQAKQPSKSPGEADATRDHKHNWPDYLVFFAQLEPTIKSLLRASSYAECYRTWNTAWHDDWRRKGDMIIWCLDPAVQREWREKNRRVHLHDDGWEALMKSKAKQFDKIIEQLGKESTGVWRGGKKGRRGGGGWIPTFSLPMSWSRKSRNSFTMTLPWEGSVRSRRWSWPWEKSRKPSWSQVMKAWYDKIVSDKSELESSDLWS